MGIDARFVFRSHKKLGRNEKKELQFNLMHRDGILSGTERNAG